MLEEHMESSGNAFVDSRRSDGIEYLFRIKDDLLSDLKKARHCIDEAIRVLEANVEVDARPHGGAFELRKADRSTLGNLQQSR